MLKLSLLLHLGLARFPFPWIFNSSHHVDLGTLKTMGHSRGLAETESKVLAREQID